MKKGEDKLDKILVLTILKYVSAQMLVPSLCPHCKIKVKDINPDEGDIVWKEHYTRVLEEIKVQRMLIKKELLLPNVLRIFPALDEAKIDSWIDNSYVENINGCEYCMKREENQPVKSKMGRKGRALINETLIFDSYVIEKMSVEPYSKKRVLHELLEIRPTLGKDEEGYIGEDKKHFFTLYQDAIFKAILPSKIYNQIYMNERDHAITILDALTY